MHEHLLKDILILLAVAVAVLAVCTRLGLPPILAYLLVGVLVGPHGLGWLPPSPTTAFLAELGVAFLMFLVGLEFSLPRTLASRGTLLGFGSAQVLVTALLATGLALALGLSLPAALVTGGAITMSSTAIGTKQLSLRGKLGTPYGRMAVAALLFQDLATIPFLTVISVWASASEGFLVPLLIGLLRVAVVFATFLFVGRLVLTSSIAWVLRTGSSELLMLSVLLVLFAAGFMAQVAGLSLPLGAFMVGMILGETDFRQDVEKDIRPFQAVLLGLFFVNVGMTLDPEVMLQHGLLVVALLAGLVLGKWSVVTALGLLFGTGKVTALRAGLILAQGGEFGLLLVTLAMDKRILDDGLGQPLLAAIILSMVLAPLLIQHSAPIIRRLGLAGRIPSIIEGRGAGSRIWPEPGQASHSQGAGQGTREPVP